MTEENYLDLDLDELDQNIQKRNTARDKVEERMNSLNEKVILTAKERDELRQLNEQLTADKAALEKEKAFLSSFTDATAKFPGAVEYKDAIWEKVQAGYSVEDATLVVTTANKPTEEAPAPKESRPESPAGGSAATVPTAIGEKSISDMTRDEKLAALREIEARGELSNR